MRRHHHRYLLRLLALLILFLSVVALVACGNVGHEKNGGVSGDLAAMLQRFPEGSDYFQFVDVKSLRANRALLEAYEDTKKNLESSFQDSGISADDVDIMATNAKATLLEGSFDLDSVSEKLEDNGYRHSEYQGIETWEGYRPVALLSRSCIVIGDKVDTVYGCIDVTMGNANSLYGDADVKDVTGRLPSTSLWIATYSAAVLQYREGLKVMAMAGIPKDVDTVHMTEVFLFRDEVAASSVMSDIGRDFTDDEYSSYDNVEVTRDGIYVTVTADLTSKNPTQ